MARKRVFSETVSSGAGIAGVGAARGQIPVLTIRVRKVGMLEFTQVAAWVPFGAWNPFSARPKGLQRRAACGSGIDFSFRPTPARAARMQEVTHSAATGALHFPVGTGGRSGTDLILSPFTQLFGTSVGVIERILSLFGNKCPQVSRALAAPPRSGFRPVEPSCKSGFELCTSDLRVHPRHSGDQR